MDNILGKTETMTAAIKDKQIDLEKKKLEALEARKLEQECIKEQETLIPLEQAATGKFVELKSVLGSEKSQRSVLKAILQAKESKQIEGIYGRMGDMGAKYDVAISTACVGLDYIVVETNAAAQSCVELLRRERLGPLGIATFMILDERMKLAFYASLGNTIVGKDLDQATPIAYGGNKSFEVWLDGALIERPGTMSGGGSKRRGGKMGTSIRANSVSRETASDLQNKLENAGGERLKTQKSKVEKIESDIDKSSVEINRQKVQIETGEKMVKKLTKGIVEYSKEEKERIIEGKDKMHGMFKEIEQKRLQFKRTRKCRRRSRLGEMQNLN
ncbi:structural maintenance of chromosomes protein 4-like [Hibiscus syriacus]|uniref:structural maintenance of chromosomes protein 4-like n=1 Tax=Hibiscus syriacus TaxID=106335 RepID=UPI00192179D2|nr:structural maintenance of chromosomes protein 4-like [Hibiscus syriacus]